MVEDILREIKVLPEGLSSFRRQEADRLGGTREEAMLNWHVLQLKASVANHQERIQAMKQPR